MCFREVHRGARLSQYAGLAALLVSLCPCAAGGAAQRAPTDAGAGWPMFRGNPRLTGVAAETLATPMRVAWKFRVEEPIESSAAIVGGTVYVGCDDAKLYAVDVNTGQKRWSYATRDAVKSSPCVAGGAVYVGDDEGVLHAVDADSGAGIWTFATDGQIISSPIHLAGRLIFGSYDAFLYCLSPEDGRLLWKFETQGYVHGTPSVVGGHVLVAGCDERLHVVDLKDGKAVGAISMGSPAGAAAAVGDSMVFIGTYGNRVLGIDWAERKIVWAYEPKDREFPFMSSAAVTRDLMVVGGRDKLVHALDARTGRARWTFATKGRVESSPVVSGKLVFAGSSDGRLYALNLATGAEVWRFDAGAAILASPAIAFGRLVLGTEDGTLYCFTSERPAGP